MDPIWIIVGFILLAALVIGGAIVIGRKRSKKRSQQTTDVGYHGPTFGSDAFDARSRESWTDPHGMPRARGARPVTPTSDHLPREPFTDHDLHTEDWPTDEPYEVIDTSDEPSRNNRTSSVFEAPFLQEPDRNPSPTTRHDSDSGAGSSSRYDHGYGSSSGSDDSSRSGGSYDSGAGSSSSGSSDSSSSSSSGSSPSSD
jgi:uncharacterized membrane protein YgcG